MMQYKSGHSTCPEGQEQWESYHNGSRHHIQYEYRAEDGELFYTVAINLTAARLEKDIWLQEKSLTKSNK